MAPKKREEDCEDGELCSVLAASFWTDEKENPDHEWRIDERGQPVCTAFVPFGEPIPIVDELTLPLFPDE
jgi:hypothetical protein